METWVTSPLAGAVSIEEGAPDPTSPSGYAFLGYSVHVTVPSSTAGQSDHAGLRDPQLAAAGRAATRRAVEMSKNGVLVDECDGGTSAASPDPCIASRVLLANGNLRVTIRSSTASYWGGLAPYARCAGHAAAGVSLTIPANKLSVTKKLLVRVRNMDPRARRARSGRPRCS